MTGADESPDQADCTHDETHTLDPDATIRSNYAFQRYDRTVERYISFRPATMDRDLGRLHTWLGYDHVAEFWSLNLPLPAFRDHLSEKLAEPHLTPYIGYIDHIPMSYWELCYPTEYELDAYYDAQPGDRAGHLLIGPPEYVGNGYAKAMFRATGRMLFSNPATNRVVGEPAADNGAVISLMQQFGFEPQHEFYFEEADKEALLMICEREKFNGPVPADIETSHDHELSEG